MKQRLTIAAIGRMFGHRLPEPKRRGRCPLRDHKRKDPTFRVFVSHGGDEIWKCWSCDAPDNVGDAIGLYALLGRIDRKEAWKKLREDGYDVPGAPDDLPAGATGGPRRPPRRAAAERRRIPVRGTRGPEPILPLPEEKWRAWVADDVEKLAAFAEKRMLTTDLFKRYGVVPMGPDLAGFLYVDPISRKPCRVKVKRLVPDPDKPAYYILPRADRKKGEEGVALGPLYLAHRLKPTFFGPIEPVIITEGEIDALTLVTHKIQNVVSLPDGSESAATVSLDPLYGVFNVWLVSTDADEPGEKAFRVLRARAAELGGIDVVRVYWKKLQDDGGLTTYKDANEALVVGRLSSADFVRCLDVSMEARFGYPVRWRESA